MNPSVTFWRRVDVAGLERLELAVCTDGADGVTAKSTIVCTDSGGFRLHHCWHLDAAWRAQSVTVNHWNADGHRRLQLQRVGTGWLVDGQRRAELEGADEPDLSVTPFSNSLAIRRLPGAVGATLTLDTAFIDAASMTVARSRQRYERLGSDRLRYVDLGLSQGFEAELTVDERGLVIDYQHLFERVRPAR